MEMLNNIPYELSIDAVISRIKAREPQKHIEGVKKAAALVQERVTPRGLYKICWVYPQDEDAVYIDNVLFNSRVLAVNLQDAERVFPYVLTCGKEFDELYSSADDIMEQFYLSEIANEILHRAQFSFLDYIKSIYCLEKVSRMNPGEIEEWPTEEQSKLFTLLDESEVKEKIGVELTPNLTMVPLKSMAGIMFPTKTGFDSCQLCPRECPDRRAPYDEKLKEQYLYS